MKKLIKLLTIIVIGVLLTACQNEQPKEENNASNKTIVLSGLVQKGTFVSGEIIAQELNAKGKLIGEIIENNISKQGTYKLNIKTGSLLFLKAKGRFFNEYTNKVDTEEIELYALLDLRDAQVNSQANINLFSSLEVRRIMILMQEGLSYEKALIKSKKSMKKIFGLSSTVLASKLDIYDMNSSLKEENQNLLLFSTTLLKIRQESAPNIAQKTSNKLSLSILERLFVDYAKDAKIKGKFKNEFLRIKNQNAKDIWNIARNNIRINRDLIKVPDWANLPLVKIKKFQLKSHWIDAVETLYHNEKALFTGLASSQSVLRFDLESEGSTNYALNIFAEVEGETRLKLVGGLFVKNNSATIDINVDSTLEALFAKAYEANKKVYFKAYPYGLSPSKISSALPRLIKLSNQLNVNGSALAINSVNYKGALTATCTENNVELDEKQTQYLKLNMTVDWQPSAKWSKLKGELTQACMELVYNSASDSFDATMKNEKIAFTSNGLTEQEIGGTTFSINFNSLLEKKFIDSNGSIIGNTNELYVKATLPNQTVHKELISEKPNILANGVRKLKFIVSNIKNLNSSWDEMDLTLFQGYGINKSLNFYIHDKALPFYIDINHANISISDDGLLFKKASAIYVHKTFGEIISNDVSFSSPDGDFDLLINSDGMQSKSTLNFHSIVQNETLFPRTKLTQNSFSTSIVNSELLAFNISGTGAYDLSYDADCHLIGCNNSKTNKKISYNLNSNKHSISKDGALFSHVDIANKKVAWGSEKENKQTFEREEDSKAVMYVPGYIIETNEPKKIVNHLMGSRDLNEGKIHSIHPLNSDAFNIRGDGLFAGLNVGKLYLSENNNDPLLSLANTTMKMQLGGVKKSSLLMSNNAYTKYYIRPSGVTGVFNGKLNDEKTAIYGYPFTFNRFAFAQVNSLLKKESWIDAQVAVPSPAGFDIDLSSLVLNCAGGFEGGVVEESDCSSTPTKNCKQKLEKWKTKTEFIAAKFTANSTDACGEKDLTVSHVLHVNALTNPLGLTASWNNQGEISNSSLMGSTLNYLDRDTTESTKKGFPITLANSSELSNKGWYKLSAKVSLPFWEMKKADIGIKNKTLETSREKSVLMNSNKMNKNLEFTQLDNELFQANYKWGSTGIEINLPIKYSSKSTSKESKFLGETEELDLSVMSANAGINFITPKRTKVSFGVSADTSALKDLNIQIDLNDPNSIKAVDNTLNTLGIGGKPLEKTIGLVLSPLEELEHYADKGLLLGMEELGLEALESLPNESDPFEIVANTFAEIHTLPIKIESTTKDYIKEEIDKYFAKAIENFDIFENSDVLTQIQNNPDIKAKVEESVRLLTKVEKGFNGLERIEAFLDDADSTLQHLSLTDKLNEINSKIDKLIPNNCTSETLLNSSKLFEPITLLRKNIKDINDEIQAIELKEVRKFAKTVKENIEFDANNIIDAFEKTQKISKSLNSEIDLAQSHVDAQLNSLCSEAALIKKDALSLLNKVNEFNNFKSTMQRYILLVKKTLQSDKIDQLKADVSTIKGFYQNALDNKRILTPPADVMSRIGKLKVVFISTIIDETLQSIDESTIGYANENIEEKLRGLMQEVPQVTAQELRQMVVTKLLNSDPIANLRVALNDALSPPIDEVREVVVDLISSLNQVVYDVLNELSSKANELLASATSKVEKMPIVSGKMDGYAHIAGDELERLHIGAEWKVDSGEEESSYSFNGALDMERWGAGGKAGCGDATGDGNMDVKISTRDIGMDLGGKKLSIDKLYFGFTLDSALPIGINGGISSKSGFDFEAFKLYDMALALGIGTEETYLGAKSAALFESYQLSVAFLVGRTCGNEILTSLDPKAGQFITLRNNVFEGAYIRGGASIPIWNNGCALTVGVSADMGVWILTGGTYGGLINGGAFGKALCIAALKGQVETIFEKSGETLRFKGTGWGAAGLGSCEPSEWSSVSKSRDDSWCGTGDAQFGASYDNGWHIETPSVDALF